MSLKCEKQAGEAVFKNNYLLENIRKLLGIIPGSLIWDIFEIQNSYLLFGPKGVL